MLEWLQNTDCELAREVFVALKTMPIIFGMLALAGAFRLGGPAAADFIRALRGR